jgi:hypothetical protein
MGANRESELAGTALLVAEIAVVDVIMGHSVRSGGLGFVITMDELRGAGSVLSS